MYYSCKDKSLSETSGFQEKITADGMNNLVLKQEDTCQLINNKQSIFDKAFLALALLSYIQPFADGNKLTARITSNAILIANGYCPLIRKL